MSNWSDYRYEESTRLEPGNHRVVIVAAEEKKSRSGNDMIVVTVQPSGSKTKINDYFVKGPYFNEKISRLFDAFPEIGQGNFNFLEWVGAMGAAKLKLDEDDYLKIHYYLTPDKTENLPPFEGDKPERQTVTSIGSGMQPVDPEDDLPF